MPRAVILFVVAVFVGFGVDTGCCFEDSVDRQFPLGTIGKFTTKYNMISDRNYETMSVRINMRNCYIIDIRM